jgi:hypothetical protein
MRLIHTVTLKLHEFFGENIPPYAILSHTWGESEVSFQEMQSGDVNSKAGYDKTRRCCEIAAADRFEYCWVDTCCIDKTSSAELSEAINSMYKWYRVADVCYVYLADVHASLGTKATRAFRNSTWFTRGWTLQELISPLSVIFFNKNWGEIGTKDSMKSQICNTTKINEEVLADAHAMHGLSVAQKMSWASKRETTREEDIAYCLLGIFGVSMPMLYGEGDYAFIRLQEEIIKNTNDHTIFAWTDNSPINNTNYRRNDQTIPSWTNDSYYNILASNPAFFSYSENIVQLEKLSASPFFMTNKGISPKLPFKRWENSTFCVAVLNCQDNSEVKCFGIQLERLSETADVFRRVGSELVKIDDATVSKLDLESIYVKQERTFISSPQQYLDYEITAKKLEAYGILPRYAVYDSWQVNPSSSKAHALLFANKSGDGFALLLKSVQGTHIPRSGARLVADVADLSELQLDPFKSGFLVIEAARMSYAGINNGGNSDRVIWQHPVKRWWISVRIERSVRLGKRINLVYVSSHTPKARDIDYSVSPLMFY